jgi:pyruvate-formate lyase-activating enzyme
MKQIAKEVIQEWAGKKKHIQDRLNKIKKRLKKYQKQEKHFELRLKLIQQYEKESKNSDKLPEPSV